MRICFPGTDRRIQSTENMSINIRDVSTSGISSERKGDNDAKAKEHLQQTVGRVKRRGSHSNERLQLNRNQANVSSSSSSYFISPIPVYDFLKIFQPFWYCILFFLPFSCRLSVHLHVNNPDNTHIYVYIYPFHLVFVLSFYTYQTLHYVCFS